MTSKPYIRMLSSIFILASATVGCDGTQQRAASGNNATWDNKYLLFQAFLDQVSAEAAAEVQGRWIDRLAGVDVFVDSHVRTALSYVRWDD